MAAKDTKTFYINYTKESSVNITNTKHLQISQLGTDHAWFKCNECTRGWMNSLTITRWHVFLHQYKNSTEVIYNAVIYSEDHKDIQRVWNS